MIQRDTASDIRISLGTGLLLLLAVLAIVAASILSAREQEQRAASQREIESRNRALAMAGEMADIGHWRLSVDPLELHWSDHVFRIHGLEPGQVPPLDKAIEFYVEEDRERVAVAVERAIATGENFRFEARLVRADGRLVDVICQGLCDLDAAGKTSSIFGIFMDVTVIRAPEREVVSRNAMFALAGEIADIGHWKVSIPDMAVFWSDQVFRIHGLDPAQGQPKIDETLAFFEPIERKRLMAIIGQAAESGEGFQVESRLHRRDGTIVDIVLRAVSGKGSDGKVVSMFGVLQDVTSSRESERSLRNSERLYRMLAENMTDLIVRYDTETRISFASPASGTLLGREPNALLDAHRRSRPSRRPRRRHRQAVGLGHGRGRPFRHRVPARPCRWQLDLGRSQRLPLPGWRRERGLDRGHPRLPPPQAGAGPHHRGDGDDRRGAPPGRIRQPGEVGLPRGDEPRDPHAA